MRLPFRTQYDTDYKSEVFDTDPGDDENLVQHSMQDECDINVIMKRYEKTGELTHLGGMAAQYGDFSDVTDYKTGMERIMEADALFMELPASIRDRFNNDPSKFVEFATDPKNLDKMREWGLAPALPTPPEPQLVKVVAEDGDGDPSPKPKAAPKAKIPE